MLLPLGRATKLRAAIQQKRNASHCDALSLNRFHGRCGRRTGELPVAEGRSEGFL
jgi:hypothetical protein